MQGVLLVISTLEPSGDAACRARSGSLPPDLVRVAQFLEAGAMVAGNVSRQWIRHLSSQAGWSRCAPLSCCCQHCCWSSRQQSLAEMWTQAACRAVLQLLRRVPSACRGRGAWPGHGGLLCVRSGGAAAVEQRVASHMRMRMQEDLVHGCVPRPGRGPRSQAVSLAGWTRS